MMRALILVTLSSLVACEPADPDNESSHEPSTSGAASNPCDRNGVRHWPTDWDVTKQWDRPSCIPGNPSYTGYSDYWGSYLNYPGIFGARVANGAWIGNAAYTAACRSTGTNSESCDWNLENYRAAHYDLRHPFRTDCVLDDVQRGSACDRIGHPGAASGSGGYPFNSRTQVQVVLREGAVFHRGVAQVCGSEQEPCSDAVPNLATQIRATGGILAEYDSDGRTDNNFGSYGGCGIRISYRCGPDLSQDEPSSPILDVCARLGTREELPLTSNDILANDGTNRARLSCLETSASRGDPIQVGLEYRTSLAGQGRGMGGMPRGWSHSYSRRLALDPPDVVAGMRDSDTGLLESARIGLPGAQQGVAAALRQRRLYFALESGEVITLVLTTSANTFVPIQDATWPRTPANGVALPSAREDTAIRVVATGDAWVVHYPDGTTESYSPAGTEPALEWRLTRRVDAGQHAIDVEYLDNRIVFSKRDTVESIELLLDGAGRPSTIRHAAGTGPVASVVLRYSDAEPALARAGYTLRGPGRLDRVIDATRSTTTYGYDSFGRLTRECDKNSRCATTSYPPPSGPGLDSPRKVWLRGLEVETSAWTAAATRAATQRAPNGLTSVFRWDFENSATNENVRVERRLADTVLRVERYQVDKRGRIQKVFVPTDGRVVDVSTLPATEFVRDPRGRVVEVRSPEGGSTRRSYDARGRVVSESVLLSRDTSEVYATTRFERNDDGQVTRISEPSPVDPNGDVTLIRYCELDPGTTACPGRSPVEGTLPSECATANGALARITQLGDACETADGVNLVTRFRTNPLGDVTELSDDSAGVTSFAYDAQGQLTLATQDPAGSALESRFGYDAQRRLVSQRDARLVETHFAQHDGLGRARAIVYAAGTPRARTTEVQYDGEGNITVAAIDVDRPESTWTTHFVIGPPGHDRQTHLTRIDEAVGFPEASSRRFTYDALGRLLSTTDAAGRVTRRSYAYDPTSWHTVATTALPGSPSGSVVEEYDLEGRLVRRVTALGATSAFRYNLAGALLEREDRTSDGTVAYRTFYARDVRGRVTEVRRGTVGGVDKVIYAAGYDRFGRLAWEREGSESDSGADTAGPRRVFRHDPARRTVSIFQLRGGMGTRTDNFEMVTRVTRDGAGRIVTTTEEPREGSTVTTAYAYEPRPDLFGATDLDRVLPRTVSRSMVCPSGQSCAEAPTTITRSFAYDPFGNVASVVDEAGTRFELVRDHRGQVIRTGGFGTDVARMSSRSYDRRGRVVRETEGAASWTWVYGPDDEVLSLVAPSGLEQRFQYDGAGRVCRIDRVPLESSPCVRAGAPSTGADSGDDARFAYDAAGNLVETIDYQVDPRGTRTTYDYDTLGRRTRKVRDGRALAYTHGDPLGYLSRLDFAWAGTSVDYTRDAMGREVAVSDGTGGAILLRYGRSNGRATRVEFPRSTGIVQRQLLDSFLHPVRSTIEKTATTQSPAWSIATDHTNVLGRRTRSTTSVVEPRLAPWGLGELVATYDPLQRLVEARLGPAGTSPATTLSYAFDTVGNLLSRPGANSTQVELRFDDFNRIDALGYAYDDGALIATP